MRNAAISLVLLLFGFLLLGMACELFGAPATPNFNEHLEFREPWEEPSPPSPVMKVIGIVAIVVTVWWLYDLVKDSP